MNGKAILKLRNPKSDHMRNFHHHCYELTHCEYALKKETDKLGRVCGGISSGNILMALPVLPDDNLMNWLLDVNKKYNGEITVNDAFSESLEKIYFEEGRPVNFRFHYEPGSKINVMLLLTIHVRRLIIGDAEYKDT